MTELTAKERKALLEAAKKVHTYKLMQSIGYQRLIKKAIDDRTRQLLAEISANELGDAESWSEIIEGLAYSRKNLAEMFF